MFLKAKNSDGPSRVTLGKERYIVNTQAVSDTDWTIIAVSAQSSLMQNVSQARNFTIVLAFFCAGLGLIVSVLFVRSFLKPIYDTVDVMRVAQGGDLSVRAKDNPAEEIDYVNRSFNELLERIGEMMERDALLTKEKYEAEYLQKTAQYDALYNQIRPHFLFNTLSTVSLLIKSKRYADAVRSIEDLSVLLRGMVNTDRDSRFRRVENCRMLPEPAGAAARRAALPHYARSFAYRVQAARADLQPLVENAIIHGCEPRVGQCQIEITVQREGAYAVITVSDNGIGMDSDQLSALMSAIAVNTPSPRQAESRSVGLVNIAQRLKLKYGAHAEINICSERDVGTRVTICIPAECGEEPPLI